MALMTDADKVKLYQERVRRAKEVIDRWAPDARKREQRYRNEAFADEFTDEGHRINTTSGIANIDAMHSSLTAVDLEVNIQPWANATALQARVAEAAVMEVWREAKIARKARRVVKDALLVGIGWLKVGYDYAEHTEIQDRSPEDLEADVQVMYDTAMANGEGVPDPEVVAASVDTQEEVTVVDRDRVVVDYMPWEQIIWDQTAKVKEDIQWIAQITYPTTAEVQGNPGWRQYVKEHSGSYRPLDELKPDSRVKLPNDSLVYPSIEPADVDVKDDMGRVAVVEYWDLTEGGTFCTFPLSSNFLLDEAPNPLGFNEDMEDRNPFVPLVLRFENGHVKGISDMELLEPSIKEKNRYRSALLNHLEKYKPKVIGPERAMGTQGKEALESKDDQYVGLEEGFNANDLQPMTAPQLLPEQYQMDARIENEMREATGVSEVQRGFFPDRKRTATETTEVVAASSARQSEKRTQMEDFYGDVARRILQLIQTFYDSERVTRLVADEGDIDWEWTAEDITMEAGLEVVLTPKQPRDAQWRRERALELVNFVAPLPEVNRLGLIKFALQQMGFKASEIREVINLPEEQKQQEDEAAQAEADKAALVAEAQGVGAASGDPSIPGGVNGPPPDDLSLLQQMGPEGVLADATAPDDPMAFLAGP